MIDNSYKEKIKALYYSDPTSLPTAYWKYENWFNHPDTQMVISKSGIAFILNAMIVYTDMANEDIETLDYDVKVIVSKNELRMADDWHEEIFFKLAFTGTCHDEPLNRKFHVLEVKESETEEVKNFLLKSYQNMTITTSDIGLWRQSPVFDSSVWIWLVDNLTGEKIALGICEVDNRNKEGVLDWIQVEPSFRGLGYGKVLVQELLKRLKDKVNIITVSGNLANDTKPEILYRSCGFKGNKLWYIYKKK